jgi:hypothetical protein
MRMGIIDRTNFYKYYIFVLLDGEGRESGERFRRRSEKRAA